MPPKKKPAKEAEVPDKELLQKAQADIVALRRLLELKTYEVRYWETAFCSRLRGHWCSCASVCCVARSSQRCHCSCSQGKAWLVSSLHAA